MAWVETESLSFTARHETADDACAQRTLDRLEDLRLRLEDRFDDAPGGITVIIHPSPGWLAAAHPFLPAAPGWPRRRPGAATWPAGRWPRSSTSSTTSTRTAAPPGEDSLAALRGTAERLYAQIVLAANNERLPPPWGPRRFARYVRWAWLIEGGAQYFAGQTSLFRAAVNTRMRQGAPAAVPALGPRRDHPRRHRLRPAGARARAATPARSWSRGCGARARRGRSSSPSTPASARSRAEWRRYLREDMPRAGSLGELPDEAPF